MRTTLAFTVFCIAGCTRLNENYAQPVTVSPNDLAMGADLAQPDPLLADLGHVVDLALPLDLSTAPDLALPLGSCPPLGASPNDPPEMGNLSSKPCDYACWGAGTIYNVCDDDMYQYCLPSGHFAPCQLIP